MPEIIASKSPLERIEVLKEQIATLESEADQIVQLCLDEGREPNETELARLNEILGEDRSGTAEGCLVGTLNQQVISWSKIQAGIEARDKATGAWGKAASKLASARVRSVAGLPK